MTRDGEVAGLVPLDEFVPFFRLAGCEEEPSDAATTGGENESPALNTPGRPKTLRTYAVERGFERKLHSIRAQLRKS